MKTPLVSIIIPMYNVENCIATCVQSVIKQSYTNFELLLIDDGCIDKTCDICREFIENDKRIYLIRKQNGGVSSARNLGLKKAHGNYVCFIDSDDYLSSDYVRKLVQDVEKVSSETLIFHNYNLVGQDLYDNISRVGFFGDNEAIEIFFTLELYKLSGPYAKLYNLDIIRRHNLRYPDDISLGEDLIFTLSYLNVVDKIYLRNISNYHIVRRNNSLNFSYYQFNNEYKIYQEVSKYCDSLLNKTRLLNKEVEKWKCVEPFFLRVIQCFFRNKGNISLREGIACLKVIKKNDFLSFSLYYKPSTLSKFIMKYLLVNRFFGLYMLLGRFR